MTNKGYILQDTNDYLVNAKFPCGEFYIYLGSSSIGITAVNIYHAVHDSASSGILEGFTFASGGIVDSNIASESNASGQLQVTTSVAHGLTTGDVVVLTNMNDVGHDKPTLVTVIDTTNFTCDNITYVSGAGASAGIVDEPAYLQTGASAGGKYFVSFNLTGYPALATKTYRLVVYVGATMKTNMVVEATPGSAAPATFSGGGLVQLTSGNRIWLALANITDTTDFTLKHANFRLCRL